MRCKGYRALTAICSAMMVMTSLPVNAANNDADGVKAAQDVALLSDANETAAVGEAAGSYVFAAKDLEITDLWGTEVSESADGKQIVEFTDQYAQIYYKLPEGVTGERIDKIKVATSSKEFSVKLCADDGEYGEIGVVYGAAEISKGSFDPDADLSSAKYLCLMNLSEEAQTKEIGNITFVLKAADGSDVSGGADSIKPVSGNAATGEYVYNAKDLYIESEIGAQADNSGNALSVSFEDKYAQVLVEIPASIDPAKIRSVLVTTTAPTKNFSVKLLEDHDNYQEAGAVYETTTITEYDLSPDCNKERIKYFAFMNLSESGMTCEISKVTIKVATGSGESFEGIQTDIPDLKAAVQAKTDEYFIVGAAICQSDLADDKTMSLVKKHFNAVTIGNELKPDAIFGYSNNNCPSPHYEEFNGVQLYVPTLNFDRGDKILESIYKWNQDHPSDQIKVRGHVLTWHSQTPEWFFHEDYNPNKPYVDTATMNLRHEWYIKNVLEHFVGENSKYKDMFYGWDVVNEAVSDSTGTYRKDYENSSWWAVYQSNEFIINAFRFANKYAPAELELYYNDYNEDMSGKSKGIVQLLKDVKNAEGTRIDGFGMQGHYSTDGSNKDSFMNAARAYAAVVGKVQLTELDFKCSSTYDGTVATADSENTKLAYRYKEIYEGIQELRSEGIDFTGMTIWGLVDKNSWLQTSNSVGGSANGNRRQMPLLFDDDYQAKPAYWTFVDESQLAPQIKTLDILQSDDASFDNGVSVKVGDALVTPVWNKDGLMVKFEVADVSSDSTDEVAVYVEKNGQIAKYAVARSKATATANGYEAIVNVPLNGSVSDEVKLDFVVTDGTKKTAFNDTTLKQDSSSEYFATAILKPFIAITKGTIKVDGELDAAWDKAENVPLTINLGSQVSADAKLLWDEENLYVYVTVKDSKLNANSENTYEQDSVEVFIDENNHKSSAYEDDDKQYRVNYHNEQSFNGTQCVEENIVSEVKLTSDGYNVEMAMKWTDITPQAGNLIGLELQINDADYSASRIGTLSWYDTTGQGWDKPSVFGTAVLSDGNGSAPVDPTPVDPTPVDPTPVDPTPVDPTPVDPTPVDPTPDVPVSTDLAATYKINNWGSGYQVQIQLKNNSKQAAKDWEIKINKNDVTIESFWNVNVKESGNYYVVTPMEWNATIEAGKSFEFGIQGATHVSDSIEILVNGKAGSDVTPVDPTPADPTPVDPTPVDPTPVDPTPVDPTPVDPSPVDPTPGTDEAVIVVLSKVDFSNAVTIATQKEGKKLSKVEIDFKGTANDFSGALVFGEWAKQYSFDARDCKNQTVVIDLDSVPTSNTMTIYKWWSNAGMEIANVTLIYEK